MPQGPADDNRWNHNIHYHPHLLALAPAEKVLDVGCGEGMLSRQMAAVAESVVGIDADEPSIALARASTPQTNVTYRHGAVMTADFEPASFDLVVAVAMLHHVDTSAALRRFRELVAPGGRIGIVGLARPRRAHDLAYDIAGGVATRFHRRVLRKQLWDHAAPIVWPPPHSYREVRAIADEELPGNTFRRHVLGRFTLTWTRPD